MPAPAVRQIFARCKVPPEVYLKFAGAGLTSVEMIAVMGESHATVRASLAALCGGDIAVHADIAAREKIFLWTLAIWAACSKLHEQQSLRRAKMEEDPHVIPTIQAEDLCDFLARFCAAHPDSVLIDTKEPHKKSVERISRDFTLNQHVLAYEVGEMRRRSETIVQKSGMAPTADLLVKLVRADVEASAIATEEEVMERLYAFFVALEFLGICTFNDADGPLLFIRKLCEHRREAPGLQSLLIADRLVRKEVFRLNTDQRLLHPTFSSGLLFVLNHCQWIWDKARAEHDRSGRKGPPREPSTPINGKRKSDDAGFGGGEDKKDSPLSKAKKRRLREKALVEAAKKHIDVPKPKAKAKGQGKGNSSGKGQRVPQEVFDHVKAHANGKCPFYNLGKCKFGDDCRDPHSCCDCGGPHSYVSAHTPGK